MRLSLSGGVCRFVTFFMVAALLLASFSQIFAQEATPIVETPVATEAPTEPVREEPPSTPDPQTPPNEHISPSISESTDSTKVSTPQPPPALISTQSNSMQPLVDVGGSVIYVESTTPANCMTDAWHFAIDNVDPSITSVTAKFSNGDVVSTGMHDSGNSTSINTHSQYMLVDAWAHSALPDSTATLRLTNGPCNDPLPDDQVYDALFRMSMYGIVPGSGAFDNVTWVLTDDQSTQVSSGSLVGTEEVAIQGLANGSYTIAFTDSTGAIRVREVPFVIADQSHASSVLLFRSTGITSYTIKTTDSFGTAIPNASIRMISEDGNEDITLISGPDGYANFGYLPNMSYSISVTKDGYVPYSRNENLNGPQTISVLPLTPLTERTLSGFVADRDTNESITGATITLTSPDPNVEDIVGISDDDGNYSLPTYNSIWAGTVSAPGYLPMSTSWIDLRDGNGVFNAFLEPISTQTESITLQVNTSDSEPAANATYVIKLGEFVEFSGSLNALGSFSPGELPLGTEYEVTIRDAPDGYRSKTETFTVTSGVSTWTMTLEPLQLQTVTLEVTTSDSELPTGAAYSIKLAGNVEFEGTLDSSGSVSLGELEQDAQYVVTIDGTNVGYQSAIKVFTVVVGEDTWTMTLEPLPTPTQEITVNVQTTDSGAVGGFFYNISGNAPGGTSGIMQFSNHIELGDLQIGSEWSVFINGSNQGYEQKTVDFTVTEGEPVWNITLAPLAPPTQYVSLQVNTSDSNPPTGATYVVMHDENMIASGSLSDSGTVELGDLPVGGMYSVFIATGTSTYLSNNKTFYVEPGVGTWNITIQSFPDVTVQIYTYDGGSTQGMLFKYQIGDGPIVDGTLDENGDIPLGTLKPGTEVIVAIIAPGIDYEGYNYIFDVIAQQEVYEVTLQRGYSLDLQVNTSDGQSPEGVRYELWLEEGLAYSGYFPESGIVTLPNIKEGLTYDVSIDGEQSGYESQTGTYTAIEYRETLTFELEPLPTEPTTTDVTMRVGTDDGGSPEGSTYTITEGQPQASSSGFIGGSFLQVSETPITGTLPADGTVVVPNLTIGATYILSIDGETAGYNDLTTNFTVESDSPTWDITLQALQPEETETPTQTPTLPPTSTPTPTETTEPTPATPSPTVTEEPATPTTTASAATPETPEDPGDSSTQQPVSGLPSTGAGSNSIATALHLVSGLILVAIAAGLTIRRGKQG